MANNKQLKRVQSLSAEAAWNTISKAVVTWMSTGGHHGVTRVAPTQVTSAQVSIALEAQMLWARDEMRTGDFNKMRLWGLGTFTPMTRNWVKYLVRAAVRQLQGGTPAEGPPPGSAAPEHVVELVDLGQDEQSPAVQQLRQDLLSGEAVAGFALTEAQLGAMEGGAAFRLQD